MTCVYQSKRTRGDSNPRPSAPEALALSMLCNETTMYKKSPLNVGFYIYAVDSDFAHVNIVHQYASNDSTNYWGCPIQPVKFPVSRQQCRSKRTSRVYSSICEWNSHYLKNCILAFNYQYNQPIVNNIFTIIVNFIHSDYIKIYTHEC